MPNSEKDKGSNVLRELKVRLYVEKDEDIANYLRKQRTTTLNSFIRFLVRDALEKYGDQDYFQAIKKLGDIERKTLAPKVEMTRKKFRLTLPPPLLLLLLFLLSLKVRSNQKKRSLILLKKFGRIEVKKRGEHLKRKRGVLENISNCPKIHMIFLKMETRLIR